MKNKIIIVFTSIFLIMTMNISCYASTYYGNIGFLDKNEKLLAENCVIMRVGCNGYYANNERGTFELIPENVMPFKENENLYIPVCVGLNSLGFRSTEDETAVSVTINGTHYTLNENSTEFDIIRRDGVLYFSDVSLSELTGRNCNVFDDLIIIAERLQKKCIPDNMVESFRNALANNWQNAYLGSEGCVTGIYEHPNNPELVYIKTDVGGIYQLDKEKNKWNPLMDQIGFADRDSLNIRSLALDPNNEKVMYISAGGNWDTWPCIVLKTVDGGYSWRVLDFKGANTTASTAVRYYGESMAVDPNDSQTVFLGALDGLFVSHDAGETFTKIPSIPDTVYNPAIGGVSTVVFDDTDKTAEGRSKRIYVGVMGSGVFVSNDGGNSFSHIEGSPKIPARMQFLDNKLYVAAVSASSNTVPGGFFCYENGKFSNITPKGAEPTVRAFLINRDNHNMIMAVSGYDWYRTYDAGKTWESVGSLGQSPHCLLQDRENPNGIWVAWTWGVFYVPDMTAVTLSKVARDVGVEELCATAVMSIPGEEAPDLHSLVMDRSHIVSENINVKGTRGTHAANRGIAIDYCAEDPSQVVIAQFKGDDPNSASTKSVLHYSSEYGKNGTFTQINWDETNRIIHMALSPKKLANGYPRIVVCAYGKPKGEGSGIWFSDNLGETWVKGGNIIASKEGWDYTGMPLAVDKVTNDACYYIGGQNLYRSMDGGENWAEIYNFAANSASNMSVYFIKTIPGVKGGLWIRSNNEIFVTYDFGKTITKLSKIKNVSTFGFGKGKDDSSLPASYAWGEIEGERALYVSDDLGVTWRKLSDSTQRDAKVYDICGDMNMYGRVFNAISGRGVRVCSPVGFDDKKPVITMETQSSGSSFFDRDYALTDSTTVISGKVSEYSEVRINGVTVPIDNYNNFNYQVQLQIGKNNFKIEAIDKAGNQAEPVEIMLRYRWL